MAHMVDGQEYTDRIPPLPADIARRAQVNLADRIGAKHPHPLDDEQPKVVGALLAKDPFVNAELKILLDAFGLKEAS
ncbi:hypothetical protein OG539_32560 [Actinacidiphila glaucinigra]|uniref:hypothetical protein n=1 Tax=Actinacidiphila glaucinigra TaxID=235986 RepID=UPI003244A313